MPNTYVVTQTIQSNDRTNPPVEVNWYRGTNLAVAASALIQAAVDLDEPRPAIPVEAQYRVLSVSMTTLEG